MGCRFARPLSVVGVIAALATQGCGAGDDERQSSADQVRAATSAYLRALENASWPRACRLMTAAARRELGAARGSCVRALARGGTLPPDQLAAASREVAGAPVRVRGTAAAIGPFESFPEPVRLERVAGRWLVDG